LGEKANPDRDKIRLDGELIKAFQEKVYIMMNKPLGVLSSLKSQGGHRTVVDLLKIPQRVYPIGRLDLNSQGLVLLTNDGDLTNKLSHPRYGHEKEYHVKLNRPPDVDQLNLWRRGVVLPDGSKTSPAIVKIRGKINESTWVSVILKQGKKRQIRETAKVLGLHVRKLTRVRSGPLNLGNLKSGEWRYLSKEEVRRLKHSVRKSSSMAKPS
jgi:23S rRNA pseudouridine2605 synthase